MSLSEKQRDALEQRNKRVNEQNTGVAAIADFQKRCTPLLKRNDEARQNFKEAATRARRLLRNIDRANP